MEAEHTGVANVPLTVRDLAEADVPHLVGLSSGPGLAKMPEHLERARRGDVDLLVVCPPSGLPVAKGAVSWDEKPDAGVLWGLRVRAELRSLGIGSVMIEAIEGRIRARGLSHAELAVEEDNPRARALYERLGYVAHGSEPASWDQQEPDGTIRKYETTCTLLRKDL
jgi:ribosomal protein S18 acetylase RimI-like enzyme